MNKLLEALLLTFSAGHAQTLDGALHLLQLLATLDIVILGLWWATTQDNTVGTLLTKIFTFGFLIWVLRSLPQLVAMLQSSFIRFGIVAGAGNGAVLTQQDFKNPENIFAFGLQVGTLLIAHAQSFSSWGVLWNAVEVALSGVIALGVMVAFGIMAIQIAMALLEMYLGGTMAMLLLPFGAFNKTACLSEKAIAYMLAHGVKLAVLAFLVSAMQPVLVFLQLPPHPKLDEMFKLALGVGFLWFLAWKAPAYANGLLSGVPMFSASSAIQSGIGAGALAGAGAAGFASGIGSLARGGASTFQAGAIAARAARTGEVFGQMGPRGIQGLATLGANAGARLATNTASRVMSWGAGSRGNHLSALTLQRMIPHD